MFALGDRHSSVVSSAPTIMRSSVWIPSTPCALLYVVKFCTIFVIELRKGRNTKFWKKNNFAIGVILEQLSHFSHTQILNAHSFYWKLSSAILTNTLKLWFSNGPFLASFSLIFFIWEVNTKKMFYIKFCRWPHSNRGPLVSKWLLCQLSHNHCPTNSRFLTLFLGKFCCFFHWTQIVGKKFSPNAMWWNCTECNYIRIARKVDCS